MGLLSLGKGGKVNSLPLIIAEFDHQDNKVSYRGPLDALGDSQANFRNYSGGPFTANSEVSGLS